MSEALGTNCVRLVPLGGLGEVGMNCLVLEQHDGILVIDCGAGFPDNDLGIDVFHPDFSWLQARAARVAGVFLTHGHEDHIGALPYLLTELDVPVWGPPHALGLARHRLAQHRFQTRELKLREAHAGNVYTVGPFEVEPIRVAHSIVEASALAIRSQIGRIVHSGDFNFDPDPPDGEPTDDARLLALGEEGVSLLLSDSTNIDVAERPGSERSVAECVERLIAEAPARVVVALFASNIQRLITLGEAARRVGRRICLLGRSLETQVAVATQIGRLRWPSDLLVSADQAQALPRERLLALAGGTQAEPNSALRRLSLGTHRHLALTPADTVIMSSRAIPGNERPVVGMIDALLRRGITVHSRVTEPAVHTSGHAGRSEQQHMIELLRPRCFLPVHGTLHHMLRHQSLARSLGVHSTLVTENGSPVVCDGHSLVRESEVRHGKIAIAFGGETLDAATQQRRSELARFGVVFVCLVVDARGQLCAPPEVSTRGVPAVDEQPSALRALSAEVERAASSFRQGRGLDFEEHVRRTTRRKLEDLSGTRPLFELKVLRLAD